MTAQLTPNTDILDNALWESLIGAHTHLSEGTGRARRYLPTVSPFVGVGDLTDPGTWTDLVELVGHGKDVTLPLAVDVLPDGWTSVTSGPGVQMIATDAVKSQPDDEAVVRSPEA